VFPQEISIKQKLVNQSLESSNLRRLTIFHKLPRYHESRDLDNASSDQEHKLAL